MYILDNKNNIIKTTAPVLRGKNWIFMYRRIIHLTTNLRVDKANRRRQINRMLKVWEYLSFTAVWKSVIAECEWSFYVLTKLLFMILVSVMLSIVCSHCEDFPHCKNKWLVCGGFTKRVYLLNIYSFEFFLQKI